MTNLDPYKNAVWDFLLEHSDISKNGALFIKFHTSNRADFERRVNARLKGYHREDPKAKEQVKEARQQAFQATKQAKRERYILSREEQRRAVRRVARMNRRRRIIRRVVAFLNQSWLCERLGDRMSEETEKR